MHVKFISHTKNQQYEVFIHLSHPVPFNVNISNDRSPPIKTRTATLVDYYKLPKEGALRPPASPRQEGALQGRRHPIHEGPAQIDPQKACALLFSWNAFLH